MNRREQYQAVNAIIEKRNDAIAVLLYSVVEVRQAEQQTPSRVVVVTLPDRTAKRLESLRSNGLQSR